MFLFALVVVMGDGKGRGALGHAHQRGWYPLGLDSGNGRALCVPLGTYPYVHTPGYPG